MGDSRIDSVEDRPCSFPAVNQLQPDAVVPRATGPEHELRLPCRDSGIIDAKPNRRADVGGNDLDQAAPRRSGEAYPLV